MQAYTRQTLTEHDRVVHKVRNGVACVRCKSRHGCAPVCWIRLTVDDILRNGCAIERPYAHSQSVLHYSMCHAVLTNGYSFCIPLHSEDASLLSIKGGTVRCPAPFDYSATRVAVCETIAVGVRLVVGFLDAYKRTTKASSANEAYNYSAREISRWW